MLACRWNPTRNPPTHVRYPHSEETGVGEGKGVFFGFFLGVDSVRRRDEEGSSWRVGSCSFWRIRILHLCDPWVWGRNLTIHPWAVSTLQALTTADGNREEHGRRRLGPHSRECMLQSAQGMSLFEGKRPLNDTASNVPAWEPQRHGGSARRDSSGCVDPTRYLTYGMRCDGGRCSLLGPGEGEEG